MHTDELFLYQLYEAILKKSTVMEGRFFIAQNGAQDLNIQNVGKIITDKLGSMTEENKYPCVVMLPPVETIANYSKGLSRFRNDLFFLTKHQHTGQGEIKTPNIRTNTSSHTIAMDWKDMGEVAKNFKLALYKLTADNMDLRPIFNVDTSTNDVITRVTQFSNDNLNGVWLQFYCHLRTIPCQLSDYEGVNFDDIELPALQSHPLHKH